MESGRFDAISRVIGARSRRGLAGALLALAAGAGLTEARPHKRGERNVNDRDKHEHGDQPTAPTAERCIANGQLCRAGGNKARNKNKNKKKGSDKPKPCDRCCSRFFTTAGNGKRRCACKPAGAACGNASQCCGGQCTAGLCGACQRGLRQCATGCIDPQTDPANRGSRGNVCDAGQACIAGTCTCTPESCADGCCAGNVCKAGTTSDACGDGGEACSACPYTCENRTCLDCSSANVCGHGCAYTSLQDAVTAANPGDTIRICAGTYVGADAIAVIDKSLTIIGAGSDDDPGANTILDGGATARSRGGVIEISRPNENEISVTISKVRITNGLAQAGGGLANMGQIVTLSDCVVTGNTATSDAAGMYLGNGQTTLTNCTFSDNHATRNAGGLLVDIAGPEFTGCTISDNTSGAAGGGFNITAGSTVTLTNSTVSGNNATMNGGGFANNGSLTLDNTSVTGNSAASGGGAYIYYPVGSLNITNGSTITGNDPDNCAGGGSVTGTCTG